MFSLNTYRLIEGQTDRIKILSKGIMIFAHYYKLMRNGSYIKCSSKRDKKGQIIGNPSYCCQNLSPAKRRFGLIILKYNEDSSYQQMVWVFGGGVFDRLRSLRNISNDIEITCTDEQFQKFSIKTLQNTTCVSAGIESELSRYLPRYLAKSATVSELKSLGI